jgi:DNA-binding transcriptional regulator YdaS (Cro superfamily)
MDIAPLMAELNITKQAELARRLGVSNSYLSDLKANRRGVTLRFASAVERETKRKGLLAQVVRERTAA